MGDLHEMVITAQPDTSLEIVTKIINDTSLPYPQSRLAHRLKQLLDHLADDSVDTYTRFFACCYAYFELNRLWQQRDNPEVKARLQEILPAHAELADFFFSRLSIGDITHSYRRLVDEISFKLDRLDPES